MTIESDQTCDRARFAAREFVARVSREMGGALSAVATDRMLFAYEMGYLRGASEATREASELFVKMTQASSANKEGEPDR